MSLRLAFICLSLLVVVAYAPLPTAAAPHELAHVVLADGNVDIDVEPPVTPADESTKPQQRTFFLLLPLLFPDQFYFS